MQIFFDRAYDVFLSVWQNSNSVILTQRTFSTFKNLGTENSTVKTWNLIQMSKNDQFNLKMISVRIRSINKDNYWLLLYFELHKMNEKVSLFQESFVWKMYQERCWDFFPAGDCFRKQYEDQLG